MKSNILVVGSGGREHSIINTLCRTSSNITIYNISNYVNPGIMRDIGLNSIIHFNTGTIDTICNEICDYAEDLSIDLVIVGPEKYLEAGLSDKLAERNIRCFGPKMNLAKIETDKIFARNLLKNYSLNHFNPEYHILTNYDPKTIEQILHKHHNNIVIKNSSLFSGKGVKVMGIDLFTLDEVLKYCSELINKYGQCIIEEKLVGHEFSLMSFVDGNTLKHMPIVQDYKRLNINNKGPQTGGMGSVSLSDHKLPFLTDSDVSIAQQNNCDVIKYLQQETDDKYIGVLYGSYMKTLNGNIKVIEFNCRFGDPEAINVLSVLNTDFYDICSKTVSGNLKDLNIDYELQSTCVIYTVPIGYPYTNQSNKELSIDLDNDCNIIYANVNYDIENNKLTLLNSRTAAAVGKGNTLEEAKNNTLEIIKNIDGSIEYRIDIGDNIMSML